VVKSRNSEVTVEIPIGEGSETKFADNLRDRFSLTILAGPAAGSLFASDEEEVTIGRGEENDLCVDDPGMSRHHVRVVREGHDFVIEDLDSKNGTYIGGLQVKGRRKLKEGDRILLGQSTVIRFSLQDAFEQEAARRMYESAVRDPLTNLYNRRYLDDRLDGEFAFAMRHASPLSVLMLDIDHFKSVNDRYGHQGGDEILKKVAGVVSRAVRTEDLVARYGGEEFIVVARGTDAKAANVLAERIRRLVHKMQIVWETQEITVTVSLGVATRTLDRPYAESRALIAAADEALYRAKEGGRNAVCTA